jgi:hypothetical protein
LSTNTSEINTIEAGWPWALPPVARVYLTPRARLRRARNRFLASSFMADIRHGWKRTLTILGAVGIAYAAVLVVRGIYVVAFAFGVTP